MKKFLMAAGLAGFLIAPVPVQAESLTPESIVELSRMQIGDDAIIAKIQSEPTQFHLTTAQMIDLKRRGVSSAVIAAMIATKKPNNISEMSMVSPDPEIPHPPGVYLLTGSGINAQMFHIDPVSTN